MRTPRWMPRSPVALAATALGTLGLGLAVVPSFAQELDAPPTEEPAAPAPAADLEEGGDTADPEEPGTRAPRENGTGSRT